MPSGCSTGARRWTAPKTGGRVIQIIVAPGLSEMQEAEASMAEDKGVPVVRLDCSEVKDGIAHLKDFEEDGGLEGADGARAQEGVGARTPSLFSVRVCACVVGDRCVDTQVRVCLCVRTGGHGIRCARVWWTRFTLDSRFRRPAPCVSARKKAVCASTKAASSSST